MSTDTEAPHPSRTCTILVKNSKNRLGVPALVGLTSLLIQNHKPSDFISCDVMHQLLFPARRRLVSAAAQCWLVTQYSGFTLAAFLTHIPSSLPSLSTFLTLTTQEFLFLYLFSAHFFFCALSRTPSPFIFPTGSSPFLLAPASVFVHLLLRRISCSF